MTTAQDLIQEAMEFIGVVNPEDQIEAAVANRGLSVLNDMLDSWSNESLACYAILVQTGSLQPGVSQYTIGPGGAFDMTRPLRIIDTYGSCYLLDSNNNKYPVDVVDIDTWNIRTSSLNVDSNIPDTLWYDPQYPLGVLNWWPIPNQTISAFWNSYLQLAEFPSLASVFSFPPGYKRAIVTNLGIELSPYYRDQMPTQLMLDIATKSKANVKRTNIREQIAVYDPAIIARGASTYNIYRDTFGRQ